MEDAIFKNINDEKNPYFIHHVKKPGFHSKELEFKKGLLLYAEGGIVHVFCEDKHWYLPGRCFMWIPPGVKHNIISHSLQVKLYILFFENKTKQDPFFQEMNIYMVNDLLREMLLFTENWNGKIERKDKGKYEFLKAIKAVLPLLGKSVENFPIQHPYPSDARLIEIARFLSRNIHISYTLDEVAREFGFSGRTLSRLFKDDIGMNYVKFLRAIRISKALELMSEKKYNVYEIALKVGFTSLSAFSNLFLKIMGIRPAEYMSKL